MTTISLDRKTQRAVALLAAAIFATRTQGYAADNSDDVVENANKFNNFIFGAH